MILFGLVLHCGVKNAIVPPSNLRRWDGFALRLATLIAAVVLMLVVPENATSQTKPTKTEAEVRLEARDSGYCFLVTKIKDPSNAGVVVYLNEVKNSDPPILGSTSIENGDLVFTPRFSLQPGTKFRVMVQSDLALKPIAFVVETPKRNEKPPKVVAVYPSSNTLPENTLKFYVQFSSPMRKGNIYHHLSIREVGGKVVELPFLEIEQEFWSRDSKRLTLVA